MKSKLLERVFACSAQQERKDLSISFKLAEAFGSPQKSFGSIHVAGTNGKGSVATKIAKALQLLGLKVGLFTSPHLFDFNERIAVSGELISDDALCLGLEEIFHQIEELKIDPNFFEISTLLAFNHFRTERVDIAVVETGIGGRLDATNIIAPLLSIITSISRDHSSILGETLEDIAKEKAGIIKPHTAVVLGPKAQFPVIIQRAKELSAPVFLCREVEGFYDCENSEIARVALQQLNVSKEVIEQGIKCRPLCRFEEIDGVIFDVAHNQHGFYRLLEALELHYPEKELRFIVGMSRDKEWKECLTLLKERAEHIHLVAGATPRAADPHLLATFLRESGYSHVRSSPSIASAMEEEKRHADKTGALLVVCGSFYLMRDAFLTLSHER